MRLASAASMCATLVIFNLTSHGVVKASGTSDETTTTSTALAPVFVEFPAVPAHSGNGRRIVYSNRQQRVWVITADNEVIRTFLVSGMLGQPGKGTFAVFSKSPKSYSPEFAGVTFRYMTRFAKGRGGGNIGFHEIPLRNGKPMETVEELGTFKGSGCLRSSTADALFIYHWATLGTKVVVV